MSKADDAFSTPAPTSKSRRAVILGAGGLAAAGALSATALALPALPTQFSPEFLHYRRMLQAHIDACDVPEPPFGTPEADAWDAATGEACEARHAAATIIQNRSIRCRRDFVELVLVVQHQLWQQEPDGRWSVHSMNDDLEDALMRAAFLVVEGGVHV